ncbi:hypothetical protein [Insulibacter thermoxylanivorax]|uniref:hypothetical protein n=1 Tax=Insulibacter thermoxylanivorax TaxID=2749268 RepID=UPI001A90FD26|nr:hypothetical protein [Insulibacter thermoxylanivorax]
MRAAASEGVHHAMDRHGSQADRRYASGWSILWYHAGLNLVYAAAGLSAWTQLWSVLPSVIFALPEERVRKFAYRLRAPKWLWRLFTRGICMCCGS